MNHQEMWDKIDPPKQQIVIFHMHPVFKSIENGVKTFKEEIYVRLHNKGSNDAISRKATEQDQIEHSEEFARFKHIQSMSYTGLECLCNKAEARTLNELGIFTLNGLAEAEQLPVLNELINKAKSILEIKNATSKTRCTQHNYSDSKTKERNRTNSHRESRSTRIEESQSIRKSEPREIETSEQNRGIIPFSLPSFSYEFKS